MWYMFHYKGPTPKRHLAFANSSAIGSLDCGPLVGWKKIKQDREAKGEAPPKLVQKYHDKNGKLRYKGLPALRSSECQPHLGFIIQDRTFCCFGKFSSEITFKIMRNNFIIKISLVGFPFPRHYPPEFGKKLVSMFDDLLRNKSGMPHLPDPCPSAEATFASMAYDDKWHDASMVELCHWLRGGKDLRVPPSFRPLLPYRL